MEYHLGNVQELYIKAEGGIWQRDSLSIPSQTSRGRALNIHHFVLHSQSWYLVKYFRVHFHVIDQLPAIGIRHKKMGLS